MGVAAHAGEVIKKLTYEGMFAVGVGESDIDDHDAIHMRTPGEGSNLLSAWAEMKGLGCVCHREQKCLGKPLSVDVIQDVLKKIKATCAHVLRLTR
jgi:hypothetical protein